LKIHLELAKKWKENHNKFRDKNVPVVLCRVCNRQFFADKSEMHNTNCVEKSLKTKA
jgi:hypothetical protein